MTLQSGSHLLTGTLEGFNQSTSLCSLGCHELCFKLSYLVSFQVLVKLEGGIGLSLINKVPEELVFASLTGINVHYTQLATSHMLELSIQDVQVRCRADLGLVHLLVFLLNTQPDPVCGILKTSVFWQK